MITIDVAVPLPLHKTFTYVLPSELEHSCFPGCRVLVPFANRYLIGMTLSVGNGPDLEGLKAVKSVLDSQPILSTQHLELGRWISWYYLSPLGEAYRVMLPPGLLTKKASPDESPEKFWPEKKQLAVVSVEPGGSGVSLTDRQKEVVSVLQTQQLPLLVRQVIAEKLVSRQILDTLVRKRVVQVAKINIYRSPWPQPRVRSALRHALNREQLQALESIREKLESSRFHSLLLHGVTASGKTEVYLNAIDETLRAGRGALMLVPEIGLTPQTSRLFRSWFGDAVAILHSALSDGERFDQWQKIRRGLATVVVGTRSAVFAPVNNLGLIIVDEEHDTSYKQSEMPRYNGRDTALKRGQIEKVPVVLGSATPQLETFHNSVSKAVPEYLTLNSRILERPLPLVHIVDMRTEFEQRGPTIFSALLEASIRARLQNGEQILILLNRRGYASSVLCRSCGHSETCANCSITLTFHQRYNRLSCHYCNYSRSVPTKCRECGKEYVYFLGEGTEKIQEITEELFPGAVVDRLDRDTTQRKGSYERILGSFASGKTDILVGTQMIAKGHDFPGVTLVGVLGADQGLRFADFRAAERTFQLLTQVAGRAGRGEQPGEVVVQTYYPNHYSLKFACTQDYRSFAEREMVFRRNFRYPPFTALANLVVSDRDWSRCRQIGEVLATHLGKHRDELSSSSRMRILGPAPAAIEKLQRDYRLQLIIKTTSRQELHDVIQAALRDLNQERINLKKIAVDVDPINLM